MRAGMNQHQALLSILSLAVGYMLLNLLLWSFCNLSVIIVVDIVVWMIFHWLLNKVILRRGNAVYQANNARSHD